MTKDRMNIPRHVAIIMDGNGRWAENIGKQRLHGHHEGVNSVRQIVETAVEIGVEYLTIYAFSTENWGRPTEEVDGLMHLLAQTISKEIEPLSKNGVQIHFIGNLDTLPSDVQHSIEMAGRVKIDEVKLNLVVAINYSSRWEITWAAKDIVTKSIPAEQITEDTITEHLQSRFMPDPDLLIRTSGEERLSNFMLWQLSYTELYFTPILWPEFGRTQFLEAIEQYNLRNRRFGLTK